MKSIAATAGREPGAVSVSFEFFPPKSDAQLEALGRAVERLQAYGPAFVSMTYGAGGTTRERSLAAVRDMVAGRGLATAAHLTCVGASRAELDAVIETFHDAGVRRYVALRGDPEGGMGAPYVAHPEGYQDTAELVARLKERGAADVSVSAYPERHPHSPDWAAEIDTLKRKVDAGADRALTQFFFDNDLFEAYLERVAAAGIDIPVVPGIMPVNDFKGVCNFARRCGASIPQRLADRFDGLEAGSEPHRLMAAAVAAEQVADLASRGVRQFHIYTLNKAELPEAICRLLGLPARDRQRAAA
ncbi:methylenetetrahydrofolate reductase [Propylenella binzhouense]|uniref:Methylenetetrahydrofolate reductase n=1 Tax=Propylenella binzhouense TaxID=2555902 RepID=A0A964T2H8_9HYPH|nr:methylenetetrahydrofolate reductase [Propylenella binzhouense]MYZ47094.1 methylenetetrahydrofolate reductase [NAD(P)H] [Propylenella binzhouense]